MLSINSISGRSAVFYALVAALATLAVVTSGALAYNALSDNGGGGTAMMT